MTTFVVFVCQLAKHSWHPHGAHSSPEMRYSTIAVIRWPCATDLVGKKIFAWFSDALKLSVSQESVGRITVAILVITIFKKHHPRPAHIKCNLVSQIVTTVFLFCWMPQNSNVEKKNIFVTQFPGVSANQTHQPSVKAMKLFHTSSTQSSVLMTARSAI